VPTPPTTLDRALQSKGSSSGAIYSMVARVLDEHSIQAETVVDVGCGGGALWPYISNRFNHYIGVDIEKYPGFPVNADFVACNLETYTIPLPAASADVVTAVETIEHLENPRAFFRELKRLLKPGGWLIVTTPNQLSLLSKLTLLFKNQFNAFQDTNYPAHITALLEVDLKRMAQEIGIRSHTIDYTRRSRIPGTAAVWPSWTASLLPRAFSDNLLLLGRIEPRA